MWKVEKILRGRSEEACVFLEANTEVGVANETVKF